MDEIVSKFGDEKNVGKSREREKRGGTDREVLGDIFELFLGLLCNP